LLLLTIATIRPGRLPKKPERKSYTATNRRCSAKGYALDFGIRHLAVAPPDAVIILDADCYADHGTLKEITTHAIAKQHPVQARYDLDVPSGKSSDYLTIARQVPPLLFRALKSANINLFVLATDIAVPR